MDLKCFLNKLNDLLKAGVASILLNIIADIAKQNIELIKTVIKKLAIEKIMIII
jgi:hypothetical protein